MTMACARRVLCALRPLKNQQPTNLSNLRVCSVSSRSSGGGGGGELQYDLVVVGGGIVGLATAREVAIRYPHMKIAVVEKERDVALHQSGRNSGVLHTGIYYTPGTLKATLCVRGIKMAYNYCDKKQIPYKKCGKLIVAVENEEVPRLQLLYERGRENGVDDLRLLDSRQLREIEPHCRGKVAIHSPSTGIVDWGRVTQAYGEDFKEMGGHIYTNFKVSRFALDRKTGTDESYVATLAEGKPMLSSRHVIACCGLHSDRVAALSGCPPEPRIVPFRGEYLLLRHDKTHLVRGNIYPVPDPRFPFLGVHFTPRMDGEVWLGPNAVLALSREGYSHTDFNWQDFREILKFRGLRKLVGRYWRQGAQETIRSLVLMAQVRQLQRYIPELQLSDVTRGPTGVRVQAMDSDGQLIEDFVFSRGEGELGRRVLHVRNAPSPAATSSLAIAEMVVNKARDTFHWKNC